MSYQHDPNATLDYAVDWAPWLQAGETISNSTWTVPTGLTQATPAPSHSNGKAVIWITGGTVGESYRLTNHITTSAGRQDERSLMLEVTQR